MSIISAKDGSGALPVELDDRQRRPHRSSNTAPTQPTLVAWLPWTNPNRPSTTTDEANFVASLRNACEGHPAPYRRTDLTALLNSLRAGMTLSEVRAQAPGLDPARMYDAYVTVDALRRSAVEAWMAIEAAPGVSTVDQFGHVAARLLPVQVARLRHVIRTDVHLLDATVEGMALDLEKCSLLAERIEGELSRSVDRSEWAMKLGTQLYDPYGECVFARSDFLAHRVGALMPQRVAELLKGNDADESHPQGLVA